MKIEKVQLDKENPLVTLTTYVLDDSSEMLNGAPRPAVIICPGGGFFSCSDREAEPVAMYFAAQGYHSFVLRYATYFSGGLEMPDLSKPLPLKEESTYPRQIRQLGKAMLYIKEKAKEWLVDPEKIGVCGFSAGGHVASLYATCYNESVLTDYLKVSAKDLKPAFAIAGYALTDYHFLDEELKSKQDSPGEFAFMKASNVAYTGVEVPDNELESKISVVDHVDSETPPFFIWTTTTDPLVSPVHSLKLALALAKKKVPHEIHMFGEGTHGLSLGTQAVADSKTQVEPNVAQWTTLCTKWLEKRFALNLPDKSPFEEMKEKEESNAKK